MIEQLANRWVDYMVKNGADEVQKPVYLYGLICFLNELFSSIMLLIIAIPLNRLWQMIIWMLVFDMLRINIGGYHAVTPVLCIMESTIVGVACTLVYPVFDRGVIFTCIICAICIGIVFRISPVLNQKHPLSKKRQNKARILARILIVTYSLLAVVTGRFNRELSAVISISMTSVCLLGLLGHFKR